VVDKWLSVQASSRLPEHPGGGPRLLLHPAFDLHNPNKVYALLNTFGNNHVRFHAADGSGYRFLAEQIGQLDRLNPQVAARLARRFDRWRKFDAQPTGARARRTRRSAGHRWSVRRCAARSSGERSPEGDPAARRRRALPAAQQGSPPAPRRVRPPGNVGRTNGAAGNQIVLECERPGPV
jgi:hypothetical protein